MKTKSTRCVSLRFLGQQPLASYTPERGSGSQPWHALDSSGQQKQIAAASSWHSKKDLFESKPRGQRHRFSSCTNGIIFIDQGHKTFHTFNARSAVTPSCLARFALHPAAIDLPFLPLHFCLLPFVLLILQATLLPHRLAQLIPVQASSAFLSAAERSTDDPCMLRTNVLPQAL
ncbi:hypothetical protein BKA70DRAFT_94514 [Coprinopsis sp. MPI-PUGE-AT-0042]|nr:hypothetical protein BKA70DRAFT_94514 [Coprinopsis sp. MPI-PUGE-AT-0042]